MNTFLIVLTDKYPYGNGETFIENERCYWNFFTHVFIVPVLVRKEDVTRKNFLLSANETLITSYDEKPNLITAIKNIFGTFSIYSYCQEINEIRKKKKISVDNLRCLLLIGILTNLRINRIEQKIKELLTESKNNSNSVKVLLYSYWMYEPALVAAGIKKNYINSRFITRAHGYDLYEERHKNNYIPYRELILDQADAIYPISENGRRYLSERYKGVYDQKISVERLGTIKLFDEKKNKRNSKMLVMASCSNMVRLKRIDRIINTLRLFDQEVKWYHFGDGELMETLKAQSLSLPNNIQVHFMGRVPNQEVQKFYSVHHIDVFLNVSETEGIPVSIMEVQSYGIPVVATDVGGTSELINDGVNGVLIKKDFTNEELVSAINRVVANGEAYRDGARKKWITMSNAKSVYNSLFQKEYDTIVHEADISKE